MTSWNLPLLLLALVFAVSKPQKHQNLTPVKPPKEGHIETVTKQKESKNQKAVEEKIAEAQNYCGNLSLSLLGLFGWLEDSKSYASHHALNFLYRKDLEETPSEPPFEITKKVLVMADGFSDLVLNLFKRKVNIRALDENYQSGSVVYKEFKDTLANKLIVESPLIQNQKLKNSFDLILSYTGLQRYTVLDQRKKFIQNIELYLKRKGQGRIAFNAPSDEVALEIAKELSTALDAKTSWGLLGLELSLKPFQYVKKSFCDWDKKSYLFFISRP